MRKLHEEDSTAREPLAAGEGELRVVDKASGVRVRCWSAEISAAALGLLSEHFPNLWEAGKQYLSLEEIRYDLHRFFSLRSSAGQASVALYRLDKWMEEIGGPVRDVEAKVYVDVADAGLKDAIEKEVSAEAEDCRSKVETGSLHAGTQCCEHTPVAALSGSWIHVSSRHADVSGRSRDSLGRHAAAQSSEGRAAEIEGSADCEHSSRG